MTAAEAQDVLRQCDATRAAWLSRQHRDEGWRPEAHEFGHLLALERMARGIIGASAQRDNLANAVARYLAAAGDAAHPEVVEVFSWLRPEESAALKAAQPDAPTLTVRPAATQAERNLEVALRLAGPLLVERAAAARYEATQGRPWSERIAARVVLDAAREATQAVMTATNGGEG